MWGWGGSRQEGTQKIIICIKEATKKPVPVENWEPHRSHENTGLGNSKTA